MRLAFVNFYSGYANRGGETYVDSLSSGLSGKHEVLLFQAGPKKGIKPYGVEEIKVSYNPNHPHSKLPVTHLLNRLFLDYFHLKELIFTLKLLPKLWRFKPDVIFPQNSGWEVIILRMFSSFINARIIVAGQSGPGWNDRINLFIRPDVFVALTKTQAVWAEKVSPWNKQKIVIIHNGVDPDIFSGKGNKYAVDLSKPIILVVGAAIKSKGIANTIMAVSRIPNVSLLVVGTGPLEKEEDKLGQKLLGKKYLRLIVDHHEIPRIYRSANVFTLCSDSSEAFGIVYLEALASGLPCVVTDDSSRHDILEDTGIYVKNPSDAKEYADKIRTALAQKSASKNLKQAGKYSWKKITAKYEKILDR